MKRNTFNKPSRVVKRLTLDASADASSSTIPPNSAGFAAPGRRSANGRPTNYRPEYAEQARKLVLMGLTDSMICEFFGIRAKTLYSWQSHFPEFHAAFSKINKEHANAKVKRALFQRAVGYTFDSEKIFYDKDIGRAVRVSTQEHVPPDVNAQRLWLFNRDRANWSPETTRVDLNANVRLIESNMTPEEANESYLATLRSPDELPLRMIEGMVAAGVKPPEDEGE